jgi:hypothetical protein
LTAESPLSWVSHSLLLRLASPARKEKSPFSTRHPSLHNNLAFGLNT